MGGLKRKLKIATGQATPEELGQELAFKLRDERHIDPDTVQDLINKGARLDVTDDYEMTPLHWSIQHNHIAITKLLIDQEAPVGISDLISAIYAVETKKEGVDIVKMILPKITDINAKDKYGQMPIICALDRGPNQYTKGIRLFPLQIEVIQLLIDNGADVNAKNKDGQPLLYIVRRIENDKKIAVVEMLHKAGARFSDAIEYAYQHGKTDARAFLKAQEQRLTGKTTAVTQEETCLAEVFALAKEQKEVIEKQQKIIDELQKKLNPPSKAG